MYNKGDICTSVSISLPVFASYWKLVQIWRIKLWLSICFPVFSSLSGWDWGWGILLFTARVDTGTNLMLSYSELSWTFGSIKCLIVSTYILHSGKKCNIRPDLRNQIDKLCSALKLKRARAVMVFAQPPPTTTLTLLAVSQLPVVRSEHVRTLLIVLNLRNPNMNFMSQCASRHI